MPTGKPNHFTKEWVLTLPKTINENGCWIPDDLSPSMESGYIPVKIGGRSYKLHRVVLCLYNDISYDNLKILALHAIGCNRMCFNPEHLRPGNESENAKDSIAEGTHFNSNKKVCPKCGGPYRKVIFHRPAKNGQTFYRYCMDCRNERRRKKRHEK